MPQKTAILAGGCFWCTEAAFEQLAGVSDVTSGYIGGSADTANYRAVCEGDTGHAEAIRITYDPAKITFEQLLEVFFDAHDPTQLNRQGNDAALVRREPAARDACKVCDGSSAQGGAVLTPARRDLAVARAFSFGLSAVLTDDCKSDCIDAILAAS